MRVADATKLAADFGQARIGIIFTQTQAVLGTTGKHAIWLLHALRNQVIHQDAQIRFIAAWGPGIAALGLQCGIQSGQHALRGSFFVTGGAIDLAGKEQALNGTGFQRGLQTARIKVIVFDGIARTQNMRIFHTAHRAYQRQLHVERQAGGDTVWIEFVGGQAFRLQINLV